MTTQASPPETAAAQPALSGRRITSQRRLLLKLIHEAGGHLDADELYRRARLLDATLSLSTVYRNLKLFKELGLIEERHFVEEHHHYEPRAAKEHYHLICLGCGRVTEFESPLVQRLKRAVARDEGFDVVAGEIHLKGYCAQCCQSGTG